MNGPDPSNALARLLLDSACAPTVTERLDALMEEVRVARLVAHMRPYLLSSTTEQTQPMVPVQRRVTHHAERRLDDITAEARRREAAGRAPAAPRRAAPVPGARHRRYPPVL